MQMLPLGRYWGFGWLPRSTVTASASNMVGKLRGTMYLLRNGRLPEPWTTIISSLKIFTQKRYQQGPSWTSWPEHKLQASVISKRGELGTRSIVLQNLNATIIRFKCPALWERLIFFIWFIGVISIQRGNVYRKRARGKKKGATGCSMIHVFSLILPKEFSSRKLLHVYSMETFSITLCLSPHCLLFAFGWELTFDRWLCILLLPSWNSSLLFLEDLAVSSRPEIEGISTTSICSTSG